MKGPNALLTQRAHGTGGCPSLGVAPGILVAGSFPPFDVFVRDGQEAGATLLQGAHQPIYARLLHSLRERGIERVYLRENDRDACLQYVEGHIPAIMDSRALGPGQAAGWIYRVACRAMEGLLSEPDGWQPYDRLSGLVDIITGAIVRNPGCEWAMLTNSPDRHRTASHSVNVAVLLVSFARRVLRIEDRALLNQIALGGLLHDMGKTLVPPRILNKPASLTKREFSRVKRHPADGLRMMSRRLRKSSIAQRVIVQHHEDACGSGYPEGRSRESIDMFARSARIIDVFDALTSERPYSVALNTYEALNCMTASMRDLFDAHMLRRFIRYLSDEGEGSQPASAEAPEREAPSVRTEPAVVAGPELPANELVPAENQRGLQVLPAVTDQGEEKMEGVEEILNRQEETGALLSGIVRALNQAVTEHAPTPKQASAPEQKPAPATGEEEEIVAARKLFPLVWQIDEWRRRFAAEEAEGAARARMLACLELLRADVEDILRDYHVEIVESPETQHGLADSHPGDTLPAGRVGFVHKREERRVVEPARVALPQERRRAG